MNSNFVNTITNRFEISKGEYNVLHAIYLKQGTIDTQSMPEYILQMIDDTGEYSEEAYENLVSTCSIKGYLHVLTMADCIYDQQRWQNDIDQFCSEAIYRPGNVDFTVAGAGLYDEIRRAENAEAGKKPYEGAVGYSWRTENQIRVLGANLYDVYSGVQDIFSRGNDLVVSGKANEEIRLTINKVEEPVELGRWWFTRFIQLSQGYRAVIHYEKDLRVL